MFFIESAVFNWKHKLYAANHELTSSTRDPRPFCNPRPLCNVANEISYVNILGGMRGRCIKTRLAYVEETISQKTQNVLG